MQVKLTEIELTQIFNSVDFDFSGDITFAELNADFNVKLNQ